MPIQRRTQQTTGRLGKILLTPSSRAQSPIPSHAAHFQFFCPIGQKNRIMLIANCFCNKNGEIDARKCINQGGGLKCELRLASGAELNSFYYADLRILLA